MSVATDWAAENLQVIRTLMERSSIYRRALAPLMVVAGLGGLIMSYLFVYKLTGHEIVLEHGPLMIAGAILLLMGLMMFSTGLLGEVLIRTYFESQGRRIYAIREVRTKREPQVTDGAR